MPRYTLRTLLIVLALGPMVLAILWFDYFFPAGFGITAAVVLFAVLAMLPRG
jgi:hypothetical protein